MFVNKLKFTCFNRRCRHFYVHKSSGTETQPHALYIQSSIQISIERLIALRTMKHPVFECECFVVSLRASLFIAILVLL